MRQLLFLFFLVLLFVGGCASNVVQRLTHRAAVREQERVTLPPPEFPGEHVTGGREEEEEENAGMPSEDPSPRSMVNLAVPFTSQAPLGVWEDDHKEACEEASALMVMRYFQGRGFASPEEADEALLRLVRLNEDVLGYDVDQTVEQVAELIQLAMPSLSLRFLRDPDEASLKQVLSEGALVIVPAAGRELGNPYFQTPGPLYHMLVLRGYTEDGYVITNDPGTRNGEGFVYRWHVLLDAIRDWNSDDIEAGERVVLVVGP